MQLGSREHEELMAHFEKTHKEHRLDREPKGLWPQGIVYQDGTANAMFLAFREGVAYGLAASRSQQAQGAPEGGA
jgi:hypothetical protein